MSNRSLHGWTSQLEFELSRFTEGREVHAIYGFCKIPARDAQTFAKQIAQ